MNKPGVAAVLSIFIPGIGQIYNGAFLRGLFWLVITPGFWIGTGGWLGWVCHLISAYTAYTFAARSAGLPRRGLSAEGSAFGLRTPHP